MTQKKRTQKKLRGAPPKFKTKEEIQEKIDAYFLDCQGRPLTGADGDPVLDKRGKPVIIGRKPPTVTGLALALGFATRKSLLDYQGKDEFVNTITRAKSMCEAYAEGRLFDRDGSNGAQFSLQWNFGWGKKQEDQEDGGEKTEVIIDV